MNMLTGEVMAEDLAQLIYKTGSGDQYAFEQLYKQSAPRLYRLAFLLMRRQDLAEDVLQEAFISVWHAAAQFDAAKGEANTWLNVIVRRRCVDIIRKRRNDTSSLDDMAWEQIEAEMPTPLESMLVDSDTQRLQGCLAKLEPAQREAVGLAFFYGFTHSELALKLNVPLGTIKAWIRRSLARLGKCLDHEL